MGVRYGEVSLGRDLTWPEILEIKEEVRHRAIQQAIDIWLKCKDVDGYPPLWGDELEYLIVKLDHKAKTATLALRQDEVLAKWAQEVGDKSSIPPGSPKDGLCHTLDFELAPEAGKFMLETMPQRPYGPDLQDLLMVESNMRARRDTMQRYLSQDECLITMPRFPRIGVTGRFTTPQLFGLGQDLHSAFIDDDIWSNYSRWKSVARNIRARRGRNIEMKLPVFRDLHTPWPWTDPTVPKSQGWGIESCPPSNCVIGDHGIFSVGSCALQVTLQAKNLREARYLHDQLSVIGPVMLALTAGAPIMKGFLLDSDTRWETLAAWGDDRTPTEQEAMSHHGTHATASALRWSNSPVFIAQDGRAREEYHQGLLETDPRIQSQLRDAGMDARLARHFAGPLARDPLLVLNGELELPVHSTTHQFDKLYGTAWPHVRLKPPSADGECGWRLEFRSPDIQVTDLENAAIAVFIALARHTILHFNLNLYIPITKIAENMDRAGAKDAVLVEQLWFRKDPFPTGERATSTVEDESRLMTLDEIVNGSKSQGDQGSAADSETFPGLIPLIQSFLTATDVNAATLEQLTRYLTIISEKASGRLWTAARWMRQLVQTHESYLHDSVVSDEICYDILCKIRDVTLGITKEGHVLHGDI